jgi:tetratricopeptide (TPR) repeat protein
VPYPAEDVAQVRPGTVSSTRSPAVDHQREIFNQIVSAWYAAIPSSADVLEALSISLELRGDGAAIDTLRRARSIAATDRERYNLAAAEVWLQVKFGLPDDIEALRIARALADSLLRIVPAENRNAATDASLAALLGRPHEMARLARRSASLRAPVPAVVLADAEALQAYAAMGGPIDSIRTIEARLERTIRQTVTPATVDSVRYQLLTRAAALALPVHSFALMQDDVARGDFLLSLEIARRRGFRSTVYTEFDRVRTSRRSIRPGDLSIDALFAEAWILSALGDTKAAIAWLQPALDAVRWMPPRELEEPIAAASLMRAIQLRADLATQMGDSTSANRWFGSLRALRQQ